MERGVQACRRNAMCTIDGVGGSNLSRIVQELQGQDNRYPPRSDMKGSRVDDAYHRYGAAHSDQPGYTVLERRSCILAPRCGVTTTGPMTCQASNHLCYWERQKAFASVPPTPGLCFLEDTPLITKYRCEHASQMFNGLIVLHNKQINKPSGFSFLFVPLSHLLHA
jgi:hypothetical protein